MSTLKIFSALAIAATLFASCESNHLFKSEKKIKRDIQGRWRMVVLNTEKDTPQEWTFDGEQVLIVYDYDSIGGINDTMDKVDYTIDVTLSAPYVKIDGIQNADNEYNKKWTIVALDTKILEIATDYSDGGVLQLEFVKQ